MFAARSPCPSSLKAWLSSTRLTRFHIVCNVVFHIAAPPCPCFFHEGGCAAASPSLSATYWYSAAVGSLHVHYLVLELPVCIVQPKFYRLLEYVRVLQNDGPTSISTISPVSFSRQLAASSCCLRAFKSDACCCSFKLC
ncbi:hypothetical protein CONLIGDRAFT_367902 [Coniochaeta ligniaria NRRL 30616]|uniref:Uncharacterized protein n=1 Tax=Coniochaeta ligniaria NRRL 30616 TaxID=1408157 RepID=A0A1J7I3F5_9PEZI|nr:hypothetical protein CONLIGDRAFT_367902 [Coniochaeta ligniaria NRRL 30616]